jgi:hypothetical protein
MFEIVCYGTICCYKQYYKQSCVGIVYDNRVVDDITP